MCTKPIESSSNMCLLFLELTSYSVKRIGYRGTASGRDSGMLLLSTAFRMVVGTPASRAWLPAITPLETPSSGMSKMNA
jgi:hypothetical protein